MHDLIQEITRHVSGMWRFRWRGLALAWFICVIGWVYTLIVPSVYIASTRVYLDTESTLRPLLTGLAVEPNVTTEVNLMTRALTSRPQLERVARETDLYLRATNEREMENLIGSMGSRVVVSGGSTNIFTISFTDNDREMALKVVRTLLNLFVEDSLGAQRSDSSSAQEFLTTQLQDLESRLTASEQRLADFKKKNVGLLPGEGAEYFVRLQSARSSRDSTRAQLALAENKRAELLRQLEGEEPTFGLGSPSGSARMTPEDAEIERHQRRLEELLLRYTENHPQVIEIRETIARLEQRRTDAAAQRPVLPGVARDFNPLDQNPVYQQMKISLSETEVEITTLRSQLTERQREAEELEKLVDTIPQVEAELARLDRDYDVTRARYDALLARLESAKLSEQAEESRDNLKFRMIEPPNSPLSPVGPVRVLFAGASLAMGIGAGIGLMFLLNQFAPVFTSARRLRDLTGLPVAGVISMVTSGAERSRARRELVAFAAGTVALFVVCATVVSSGEAGATWVQSLLRAI